MADRKLVKDKFSCLNSIEGLTIDDAIEFLKKEKDKILSDTKYKSVEIIYDYKDYYDDIEYMYIVGVREENDKEFNARLKQEQEQEKTRETWERQQLATLMAKYKKKIS